MDPAAALSVHMNERVTVIKYHVLAELCICSTSSRIQARHAYFLI